MAMKSRSPEEIDREIERLTRQRDGGIVDFPRVVGRERRPVGCKENTLALLKHYDVTARYNEMTKKQEIRILGQSLHKDTADNDSISVIRDMARLQQYDPNAAEDNVNVICSENAYHPARNWILERPWDHQDRIGKLLATLDTVEEEDFVRMLLTKWMIGTVSLVMYDTEHQSEMHRVHGFKGVEGILVFKGKQGLGKTQWIESLVPRRSGWVKDAVRLDPSSAGKDTVLLAISHWIVELGEIDATFRKADVSALKGFATEKEDVVRPPYAKKANRYQRRTAFTGTVNDTTFLAESGEHRRWWVVSVNSIDPNHNIDIQQLWAQAYALYLQGVPHWLKAEERALLYANNAQYERVDPLLELLESRVVKPPEDLQSLSKPELAQVERLGAAALATRLLDRNASKPEANAAATWLVDKGFKRYSDTLKFLVKVVPEDTSVKLDVGYSEGARCVLTDDPTLPKMVGAVLQLIP